MRNFARPPARGCLNRSAPGGRGRAKKFAAFLAVVAAAAGDSRAP